MQMDLRLVASGASCRLFDRCSRTIVIGCPNLFFLPGKEDRYPSDPVRSGMSEGNARYPVMSKPTE